MKIDSKDKLLSLHIIAPDEELVNLAGIKRISLKLLDGSRMSIYPEHAPLLALTSDGPIKYFADDREYEFNTASGIIEINNNVVSIFTENKPTYEKSEGK